MKKIVTGLMVLIYSMYLYAKEPNEQKSNKIQAHSPHVVIETNVGKIELKLYPDKSPLAVENFLGLVKKGYYNGTIFHRVIKGFMIQGGDPTGTGRGGESIWGKVFKNEYSPNLVFDRPFLLAMANRGMHTNGSQFFITTQPAPHLNGGYTIFGEVVLGKEVIQKIESVSVSPGANRPLFPQTMKKVYIKQ